MTKNAHTHIYLVECPHEAITCWASLCFEFSLLKINFTTKRCSYRYREQSSRSSGKREGEDRIGVKYQKMQATMYEINNQLDVQHREI